ncbi:hypothetical protein Pmani_024598 [Petrolisthes manimaculis]|uniref:Sodium-dependent multivitamin transporter n=1 Tax=Petrolisthes manimaculis TaxID=1843537 RepID=A0AAE1P9Q8_9EUCA|nr:hypothetical protein Pmani_024598 [Petrolisthes manimaculis]
MEESRTYFGLLDYVIFASVLAVSSAIGIYYRFTGGKQRTFKEYMMADKNMSVLPVAFSLMASFMSAITILGVSKENYSFGTQFVIINISYILSTPIVCYLYLPVFFRLQNTSVYEYLERRFGSLTRTCASIAFSLQMNLYMGIVLYAPALALSAVTGISLNWSIITVGLVCTFYSTLGGMKAVLITDMFQSLLMFAAVFAVLTRGVMDFGVSKIFSIANEGGRLEFFNVSLDPRERHTVWSLGIGGIFTYCSLYGVNQAQVQRLLTIKDLHRSQASLWIQWPILMLLSFSTSFAGLVLYAEYQFCDPIVSERISNSDQLLPLYVVEKLGNVPGLSGLFVSGIFSGSLSTMSSALNSLSAVTLHDYVLPFAPANCIREKYVTQMSKILVCVYGCICIGVAFMTQLLGTGVLQASLTIFGAVGGPLLALFTLGMLCKCANQKGAMSGLILGLVLTLWIGFGQPKPPPPFKPVSIEGCLTNDTVLMPTVVEENATLNSNITSLENAYDITIMVNGSTWDETAASLIVNGTTTEKPEKSWSGLEQLYAVSYMWVATIGFMTTMLVGIVVSVVTGGNTVLEPELFSSLIHLPGSPSPPDSLAAEKIDLRSNACGSFASVGKENHEMEQQTHL